MYHTYVYVLVVQFVLSVQFLRFSFTFTSFSSNTIKIYDIVAFFFFWPDHAEYNMMCTKVDANTINIVNAS